MAADTFDAVIIGAGPAGEVVAGRLQERGLAVALVEQELVGGECAYWACMPSKTLLRPAEVRAEAERVAGAGAATLDWSELAAYRDYMIRELDDSNEVDSYEKQGTRVIKGKASLRGPGEVEVDGHVLRAPRIVIATGSEPKIPPIDGLEQADYWTNREATTLKEIPGSAIVLGGGPVGIELAQFLRRFGAEVTLVEASDRLLAREDPRVSVLLGESLEADGITVRCATEIESVQARDGRFLAALADGGELEAERLIIASGRRPRVAGLGLERIGISESASEHGIEVDQRCRAAEGVWAVGDVTGVAPFTHVAKYQGRVVCADIAGEQVSADYRAVPRVVFSDPEIAAVGVTLEQARSSGIDVVCEHLRLPDAIARPWTYETDPRGELAVLVDRSRSVLIGAWAVAPLAGEWIHLAVLAIKAQIPLAVLRDTIPQFPTYAEGYQKILERLDA